MRGRLTFSLTQEEHEDILRLLQFLREGAEEEGISSAVEHITKCIDALNRPRWRGP